jgi:hypothetical protein
MNGNNNSNRCPRTPSWRAGRSRRGITTGVFIFAAGLLGVVLIFQTVVPKGWIAESGRTGTSTALVPETTTSLTLNPKPPGHDLASPASPITVQTGLIPLHSAAGAPSVSVAFGPQTNRDAHQLMAELTALAPDATAGAITRQQAENFTNNLAELVQQGAASVPAIRGFLDKNLNTEYGELNGGEQLGYSSLRASLFDTLKQIGGPEAEAAMAQALQTTAVPSEILELAKMLEEQAPGRYRNEILTAAHEALQMSSANQLGPNTEVGPVFRIFQVYSQPDARAVDANGAGPK